MLGNSMLGNCTVSHPDCMLSNIIISFLRPWVSYDTLLRCILRMFNRITSYKLL